MTSPGGITQHRVMLTLDVLPNIFEHISSTNDLFNICLTSRSVAYYALNRLYDGTLFVRPWSGSHSLDNRRYAKVLRVLACHPALASRVQTFAVPYMDVPHERFDELWVEAFTLCDNISEFRWRSTLPLPHAILTGLASKAGLRVLTIPTDGLSTASQVKHITRIHSLEQLTLVAPDRAFRPTITAWVNSMKETLIRLHIEGAEWLEDSLVMGLCLPNLKVLTLHDCPSLSAAGVLPLLRSSTRLENLYLGVASVKVADLVRPEDRGQPPSFSHLRKISINWERSLAFWIHVQVLLENSPIETFHIIRSSTLTPSMRTRRAAATNNHAPNVNAHQLPPAPTIGLFPALNGRNLNFNRMQANPNLNANHNNNPNATAPTNFPAALPLPHALLSPDVLADITTFALNEAAGGHTGNTQAPQITTNNAPLPGLFAFGVPIPNPFRRASHSTPTSPQLRNAPMVDDSFVTRFVALHSTTLRKFWVVGMRCSEDAIRELCESCERLERVRADDVDAFPMIQRSMHDSLQQEHASSSRKSVWSWWWARRSEDPQPPPYSQTTGML